MNDLPMDALPVDEPAGGDMSAVVQAVNDLQAVVLQTNTDIQSLHNSIFFLIGLIAGVIFAIQLLKGWLNA